MIHLRFLRRFVPLFCVLAAPSAFADGIDLVPYFTRAVFTDSIPGIIGIILFLILINYGLNFAVIGLPAIWLGSVPKRTVACDLIILTIVGQIADRIGAFFAAVLAQPVEYLLIVIGLLRSAEASWVLPLLSLNFFFSGISVGTLAFYFLRCRWKLRVSTTLWIAIAAAILTNPAWVLCIEPLLESFVSDL